MAQLKGTSVSEDLAVTGALTAASADITGNVDAGSITAGSAIISSNDYAPLTITRTKSGAGYASGIKFVNSLGTLGSIAMKSAVDGGLYRYTADGENSYMVLDSSNYKTYCTPANIGAATSNHSHSNASTSVAGFMTAAMVTKLNGIATGATATSATQFAGSTSNGRFRAPDGKFQLCWRRVNSVKSITGTWGSLFESSSVCSLGNWYSAFNIQPATAVGVEAGTTGCFLEYYASPTTSSAGSYYLLRPSSHTAATNPVICAIGVGTYA